MTQALICITALTTASEKAKTSAFNFFHLPLFVPYYSEYLLVQIATTATEKMGIKVGIT